MKILSSLCILCIKTLLLKNLDPVSHSNWLINIKLIKKIILLELYITIYYLCISLYIKKIRKLKRIKNGRIFIEELIAVKLVVVLEIFLKTVITLSFVFVYI